jgi:chlorophyll synthase
VLAAGALPDSRSLTLALLYSLGAHGIMTLNDFKSVEGDRQWNIASLPVQLGVNRAARLACIVMALPQMVVIGLIYYWGQSFYALAIAVLLLAQFLLMQKLLRNPHQRAAWYNATGTSLYVLGMLIAAFALQASRTPIASPVSV